MSNKVAVLPIRVAPELKGKFRTISEAIRDESGSPIKQGDLFEAMMKAYLAGLPKADADRVKQMIALNAQKEEILAA